jgi:glucose-6-phosphate isomerase
MEKPMQLNGKGLWQTAAHPKLLDLARQPYDLTAPAALLADARPSRYCCPSRLLRLHYATQRLDDRVLDALQELADELQLAEQFRQMRRGAVVNRIEGYPSENRQVLHTACRDLFDHEPAAPEATAQAQRELDRLQAFLAGIESGRIGNGQCRPFTTLVHIGIGGSDLGPRSILEALRPYGLPGREVHCVANVDPDDVARVLARVDLATALVCVVSKSGTTLETLTNEELVRTALRQAGLDPARHCVAVTGEGSPMASASRYLDCFKMFDAIGGRFSSTSMVGMVMLAFFLGYPLALEFLRGAATVDREAEEKDIRRNLSLLLALIGVWNHNYLGYPTLAVLPYSQALHRFPAHLQQCDMESNGKAVDRLGRPVPGLTGPVVWGEPGTNGQHAFYQLLHQGTEIVPVEFIGFHRSQQGLDLQVKGTTSQQKLLANLYAQMVAMAVGQPSANPNRAFPGNRPSSLLLADRLTPEVMGALLAVYEAKIVFQGFTWNINSFDQEGVQLGKVLADRFLAAMADPLWQSMKRLYWTNWKKVHGRVSSPTSNSRPRPSPRLGHSWCLSFHTKTGSPTGSMAASSVFSGMAAVSSVVIRCAQAVSRRRAFSHRARGPALWSVLLHREPPRADGPVGEIRIRRYQYPRFHR